MAKRTGDTIDEMSSPSVFTVGIHEHHTNNMKKNLHFTSIHERDEGVYECEGRNLDGHKYKSHVNIVVLDKTDWNDGSRETGALVGEPLTIDCGVRSSSENEPQIEITNGDGEALDPNLFKIAGNEVTIEQISKDFNGKKISCVHVELVTKGDDVDYPIVDRKDVEIQVWHQPEFDEYEKDQYTIIAGTETPVTATLVFNVTQSNPAPTYYSFFRGSLELDDPNKYELTKLVGHTQGAELKINDVEAEDLDKYRCEVSNGKAGAEQIIHLKEATPPPQPEVSLEEETKHSLTWKIESVESEESLPVRSVSLQYLRKSILDDQESHDESDVIEDHIWEKHGSTVVKHLRDDELYKITGLRQGTNYIFKFRLLSEAGAGDTIVLTASTAHNDDFVQDSSCGQMSLLFLLPYLAHYFT